MHVLVAVLSVSEPTWVFFTDKGVEGAEAEAAVARAARELSPRALARRVRERGDRGVDLRDVPPAPAYVRAVLATGARLRTSSRWLDAISVEADAGQRAAIAALPHVGRVVPVARGRRAQPGSPRGRGGLDLSAGPGDAPAAGYGLAQQQLDLLGVPTLRDCGLTGEGVVIGVQDSGFILTHQAFAGVQVIAARDFVHGDDVVSDEANDKPGQHDHGTAVLSTIVGQDAEMFSGVAPGASVILAKTEDVSQETPVEEDYLVAGLEWIEGMGADLWTASLGYLDWYTYEQLDGKTTVSAQASLVALQNGLIMFNAMGNFGPNPKTLSTPADVDGIIALGAVDFGGDLAGFSSRGPTADGRTKPDVLAPGAGVWAVQPGTMDQYKQFNGTSLATPLAAGVGALLKQAYPKMGPAQMLALLHATASDAAMPNNDRGWGLIDGPAAAGLYCTCVDADKDEHFDVACGGDDCDDADPSTFPGAPEACDGADNDCDMATPADEVDADGDEIRVCANDCDDADPAVYPGAVEVPDDCVDNDCDGAGGGDCGTGGGSSGSGGGSGTGEVTTGVTGGVTGGGEVTTGAAGSSGSTGAQGELSDEQGCGCASTGAPSGGWLLLLAGLGRRRRRA